MERGKQRHPRLAVVALVACVVGCVLGSTLPRHAHETAAAEDHDRPTTRSTPEGVTASNAEIVDRLLTVVAEDVVPLTQQGVRDGNKLFGAAILRKSDLSLVLASTNTETENPLWHGEVHLLKTFYEMPAAERPDPKDLIFLATHEPCPMCLSAITWGGFDNFYYLFSYEDSRDSFQIPHDLRILKEVFKCDDGAYAHENAYWTCYSVTDLIASCDEPTRAALEARVAALQRTYDEMSEVYQRSKGGAGIPLD